MIGLMDRQLLSGDEAVALAALHAGVTLGTGYPGTPSTEILEAFSELGGHAQWAPNEKVALEVWLGSSLANARTLVTMKHVGLNVAADPLFTAAYTGVVGALVVVSADDPGMSSSQNEQDNRRYAIAAGLPCVEPADSQEAYDFFFTAIEMSERWSLPVLFRMTTRVCHSKSVARHASRVAAPAAQAEAVARTRNEQADAPVSEDRSDQRRHEGPARRHHFEHDIAGRVMIPANARPAHRRLRAKLAEIAAWGEGPGAAALNRVEPGSGNNSLGIVADGVACLHAREAAPDAPILRLGLVNPLPVELARSFAASVERCVVVEEGDPVIADGLRAAGIPVESKPEMYRFGELDVARVRRILAGDVSPEASPPRGKPPELCPACPYHIVYGAIRKMDLIAAGDIGCYTLGVLPPYQAMDTCVAMGASIGVGLGLRHSLPPEEARRVVSIIGDSTFVHSGITGLVEMAYNPPPTGHVVIVLDNGTTAMTGQQEHPATGRTLDHHRTHKLSIEGLAREIGIKSVTVIDPHEDPGGFERLLAERLAADELSVIVARRPCILAAADIRKWEQQGAELQAAELRARAPEQAAYDLPEADH
jgi:indolepyruvate ferredoxin oxidoreductase alpha subunit